MLFAGQKLSGAQPKATTNSGLFGGNVRLSAPVIEQANYTEQYQKAQQVADNLRNISKFNAQKQYQVLNDARNLGMIDKTQQLAAMKQIAAGAQAKTKADFTKSLTPLESAVYNAGNFTGDVVRTVGSAYNTFGKGLGQSFASQDVNSSIRAKQQADTARTQAIVAIGKKLKTATPEQRVQLQESLKRLGADVGGQEYRSMLEQRISEADPLKNAAALGEIGLDIITAGTLEGATKTARAATATTKLGRATQIAKQAGIAAIPGTIAGGLSAVEQKGAQATPQDILTSAAVGGALSGAIPVVGAGLKVGAGKLSQAVQKAKTKAPVEEIAKVVKPAKVVKQPKRIKVDTPQVTKTAEVSPVETKVSGSAKKAEARAVEKQLVNEFSDQPTYKTTSYKENAKTAVDLVDTDRAKAYDIATGKTTTGVEAQDVAVARALEQRALKDGDVDTLRDLASSTRHTKTSEAAQRLGAEGYGVDPHSPVAQMQSVINERVKAVERRSKVKVDAQVAKEAKTIAKGVKTPDKYDWSNFVESLRCK